MKQLHMQELINQQKQLLEALGLTTKHTFIDEEACEAQARSTSEPPPATHHENDEDPDPYSCPMQYVIHSDDDSDDDETAELNQFIDEICVSSAGFGCRTYSFQRPPTTTSSEQLLLSTVGPGVFAVLKERAICIVNATPPSQPLAEVLLNETLLTVCSELLRDNATQDIGCDDFVARVFEIVVGDPSLQSASWQSYLFDLAMDSEQALAKHMQNIILTIWISGRKVDQRVCLECSMACHLTKFSSDAQCYECELLSPSMWLCGSCRTISCLMHSKSKYG